MKGIITATQRLSINDGPGIRTTIFLKGCNLRCRWCHNPETWSFVPQIQQIKDRCIACGTCLSVCRYGAVTINKGIVTIDRQRCVACGQCAESCPSGALRLVGKEVESADLVDKVAEDIPFYEESGGGVTVSGGEPLCQLDFTTDILKRCKEREIQTAIESNLAAPIDKVKQVLPYVDLWMVDLKSADPVVHKQQTGVSNEQTIANLTFLAENQRRVIVRTPVIPFVNDSDEQIVKICEMLSKLHVSKYELLPFHMLGFDKFIQFGIENPIKEPMSLEKGRIEHLREIVKQHIK